MDPRDGGPDVEPTTVSPEVFPTEAAGVPALPPVPRSAPGVERDAEPTRFNPARQSALASAGWSMQQRAGSDRGVDLHHHHNPDAVTTSVNDDINDDLSGDPDGEPTTLIPVPSRRRRGDWNWVEEWRSDGDRPAWGPGIAVGVFVAAIVAVALIVLTSGVVDNPLLAVGINVVIAAGMAPALWLSRGLPVLRFLAGGAAAGLVIGWIWMLATFPGAS